MSAEKRRLFGHQAHLEGEPEVKIWTSPAEAEVDAMPPLPKPQPRGEEAGKVAGETAVSPPALPDGVEEDSTHAFIFQHPQKAAAVLRTLIRRSEGGDGPLAGIAEQQLAAVFLIAAGQEIGSRVLKHLDPDEVASITQALVLMNEVAHHVGMHALELVRQRIVAGEYVDLGGEGYARGLLTETIGTHRANEVMERVLYPTPYGFEMLKNVAPEQMVPFIAQEHPQTVALILSQLDAPQASGILGGLPERMQSDVAYRMATMENVPAAPIERIEETLSRLLRDMMVGMQDVGGPKVVADVLNLTGSSTEKNVLDQMDAQDPEVAEAVRNLMFTFEDIAKLKDQELQTLLREVDQKDLVVALKGAREEMKEKILRNLSEETRTFITEEMEYLGPMRLSEVEEVQLRIVQQVRQLEEQGQITIVRGDADDQFV